MKGLSTVLALIGVLIAIFTVIYEQLGGARIILGNSRVLTSQLLSLSIFLVTTVIAMRISFVAAQRSSAGLNTRDSLLLIGTIIVGVIAIWKVESRKWFSQEDIVEHFQILYYTAERLRTTYLGIASLQYPTDNWVMQEIISEIKPDFIVETGTNAGGTALFYASVLEKVNDQGKVITVDVQDPDPRVFTMPLWKERVEFIRGSSIADDVVKKITSRVRRKKVLVTFDSLHDKEHVLKEIQRYSELVSVNSYMIVQDTSLMGHPIPLNVYSHEGEEGPWEAVQEFLASNKNFVVDKSRERFLLTSHPSGFLKRVN